MMTTRENPYNHLWGVGGGGYRARDVAKLLSRWPPNVLSSLISQVEHQGDIHSSLKDGEASH